MKTSIVLTVIAEDQPGIIKTVSDVLDNHRGSWTQSSMSSLAGHFAGILMVSVPADNADACVEELHGLESIGIKVIANISSEATGAGATHEYSLTLLGNDRKGIVNDVTTILAGHHVNVNNLETFVEAASMGGAELFKASAELIVPAGADIDVLESELEELANELMVNITLKQ